MEPRGGKESDHARRKANEWRRLGVGPPAG
jgi:hypothetical protein